MTIYRGAHFSLPLTLVSNETGEAVDITGWRLQCQIRDTLFDENFMIDLTTENGGITIVDAPAGKFRLDITATQNKDFSLGNVVGDVFRTDADPGPVRLFGFKDKVREPVTREAV